ncbi:hypothetical protein EPUS_00351 [Endocarpon pusillum Z07020]|uniref:Uncharacterized protein n=1 Tax=Endocarpon pusillum (strain Z07020 / HMAS-L-300199) TaxID=1263415 RepID=U1HME9_ENDPU|nr:uncharacterized protein EPUS_00351 [Endocarpon pusillum Z07020]ERF70164.1 hypothetical protein EPUS_00351 [Endocarpon pusillum Z07020]
MLASSTRSIKPKLSLSISTAAQSSSRPSLSLKSPMTATHALPRTPVSPSPCSPTARNTRLNQRGYSTLQQPSFAYANTSSQRSILKKASTSSSPSSAASSGSRRLQFREEPTVYAITPIEAGEDYYGAYTKMSREERRWTPRR